MSFARGPLAPRGDKLRITDDEYRVTNAVAIQKTFVIHLYISSNTHVDGCSVDGVSEPETGVEI